MRSAIPAALVLAALLSCAVLPALAEGPRGPNENGDDWAIVSASAFSTAPVHVGDQNVSLSVTMRNIRPGDADVANGDERMYNAVVDVNGVEDSSGKLLAPAASPLVWNVSRVDNDGNGYNLGHLGEANSSFTFKGLSFDVKGTGAQPGKYNVSIKISYEMMTSWSLMGGPVNESYTEDEDNIQFEIAPNVAVGSPVAYSDGLAAMPLYSGASFQLIGIPLTTLSGALDQLVASITIPTVSALKLSAPAGTTLTSSLDRLAGTATLYFRIDVPSADPGIYDASNANITLSVSYVRENNWNGTKAMVAASENGFGLAFMVDFTPLLNASAVSPATITRGTTVSNLTVQLRNEGNADLVRVKASLDVSTYFAGGAFYYDGNGDRVSVPLEQTVASIKRGESAAVTYPMAVFSLLPPGIHRLPVRYSGYYERSAGSGSSSGLYAMSDALFYQLRGDYPSVRIEVKDTAVRLAVAAALSPSSTINPGGESQGIGIDLQVRNDEMVAFRDVELTLLAGNGTPLRNPSSPGAQSLEPVRLGSLAPGQTAYPAFFADLDRALAAGFQQVTLRFNATSADSNLPVGMDQKFTIRTGPFGPIVSLAAGADIRLGGQSRGLSVPLTVQNSGGARLSDIDIKVRSGPSTPLLNPSDASAAWLEPGHLSVLEPLSSAGASFLADLDPNATAQTWQMGAEVTGRYFATGESFTVSATFPLMVLPAPARLAIQGTSTGTTKTPGVEAGRSFTLTIRVQNIGGDIARSAFVALGDIATSIPGNGSPSAAPQQEGQAPFSAEIAVKYIGDLKPGDEVSVAFNMLTDSSAPGGRVFREPVLLGFDGPGGAVQYQTVPVSIKVKGGAASAPAAGIDWAMALLTIGFIAVLAILLAVLIAPVVSRAPRAPPAKAVPLPATDDGTPNAGPSAHAPIAAPVAQPVQQPPPVPPPPPPPPPQKAEPAIPSAQTNALYQAPLPPPPPPPAAQPPVAPPVADGGKLPEGYRPRPGPLENYNIPGAEQEPRYAAPPQKPKAYSGAQTPMRVCPSCGNEVKMRFVKCPICGADLPPAS